MDIVTIEQRNQPKILRAKTALFDFAAYSKQEIAELIRTMRETMKRAQGVGLAANQIGLNISVFVAQVDNKFYAVFNPELVQVSDAVEVADEGCLSVPKKYGPTPRAARVVLKGFDKGGKPLKIKAWGLLARVFQHEVDHLNGKLFIDRAKEVHEMSNI